MDFHTTRESDSDPVRSVISLDDKQPSLMLDELTAAVKRTAKNKEEKRKALVLLGLAVFGILAFTGR